MKGFAMKLASRPCLLAICLTMPLSSSAWSAASSAREWRMLTSTWPGANSGFDCSIGTPISASCRRIGPTTGSMSAARPSP